MSGPRIEDHLPSVIPAEWQRVKSPITAFPSHAYVSTYPGADARLDPPRHLAWAGRLRGLAALVDKLEDLESSASLAASADRWPDVAGAGRWLDEALGELAAALEAPTVAGLGAALVGLAAAEASLDELVARRRSC